MFISSSLRVIMLQDYLGSITDQESKKRYTEKLQFVDKIDPYEISKEEWDDNIDLWPAVTHVHACMYLLLTPSPYSQNDLLNYKSLDSYKNFVEGWVRQVLVKAVQNNRIVIGKVS